MNKLFKIVMASFALLVSASAFAQLPAGCLPAPQVQGQPPKCWDGRQLNPYTGQWGWPVQAAAPQVQYAPQQYVVPQYAPQPYYGGQQYYGQPNYGGLPPGMIPIQGNPGFFQQGGNVYRCSAVASWGGGLLGAGLGYLIGKNVTISGHRLSGAGAVLGAVAGNQIACELVRPSVPVLVYAPQPQMMAPQPMAQQYAPQPMLQQAAVIQSLPQQVVQPAASGQGTFCNIDGVVTHEVNSAACVAKAKAKAETVASGQNVDMKHQERAPTCASGKTWTKLNWPGHHQHDSFVCLPDGDPHRY